MNERELREMQLHEVKELGWMTIVRVIGGWTYIFDYKRHCNGVGDQIAMTSVFVPETFHGRMDA